MCHKSHLQIKYQLIRYLFCSTFSLKFICWTRFSERYSRIQITGYLIQGMTCLDKTPSRQRMQINDAWSLPLLDENIELILVRVKIFTDSSRKNIPDNSQITGNCSLHLRSESNETDKISAKFIESPPKYYPLVSSSIHPFISPSDYFRLNWITKTFGSDP